MNIEFFTEANKLWRKGLRNEAFECLDKFINSFENDTEKELWVKEYLPTLKIPKDEKIKSEFAISLFKRLIAPTLVKGVKNKDAYSMFWTYKLWTNFLFNYNKELITAGIVRHHSILLEMYALYPNNSDIENLYFTSRIGQLKRNLFNNSRIYDNWNPAYAENYYPEDCQKDLDEVKTLKKIDRNKEYAEFLQNYENNLNKLMEKLLNK